MNFNKKYFKFGRVISCTYYNITQCRPIFSGESGHLLTDQVVISIDKILSSETDLIYEGSISKPYIELRQLLSYSEYSNFGSNNFHYKIENPLCLIYNGRQYNFDKIYV